MGDLASLWKATPSSSGKSFSIRMVRDYDIKADSVQAESVLSYQGWGAQPDWATCPEAKQERAAIMEYDGKLSRQDAEKAAGVHEVGHATKE